MPIGDTIIGKISGEALSDDGKVFMILNGDDMPCFGPACLQIVTTEKGKLPDWREKKRHSHTLPQLFSVIGTAELVLLLIEGNGVTKEKEITLTEGRRLIIPPGVEHEIKAIRGRTEIIIVVFTAENPLLSNLPFGLMVSPEI